MILKATVATTVGELREVLKDLPSEMLVIQSCDTEGNSFLPLMKIETGLYSPEADMIMPVAYAYLLPPNPCPVVCLRPAHSWQHAETAAKAKARYVSKK